MTQYAHPTFFDGVMTLANHGAEACAFDRFRDIFPYRIITLSRFWALRDTTHKQVEIQLIDSGADDEHGPFVRVALSWVPTNKTYAQSSLYRVYEDTDDLIFERIHVGRRTSQPAFTVRIRDCCFE